MSKKKFWITKSHGGRENFSRKKLYTSLKRSGLKFTQARKITDQVAANIEPGENTQEIYQKALSMVKTTSPLAAAHYSLKKAIFDLGPTGHLFEIFISRYFAVLGFHTEICQSFKGQFVRHEVDVVLEKEGKRYFVECKFHNRIGIKNDIKIALYVKARWDDLKNGPEGKNLFGYHLVSNTAFSTDALTYAKGVGLNLLGVNAPPHRSLLDEIKIHKLYPITTLRRLPLLVKNILLNRGILLVSELNDNLILLKKYLTPLDLQKLQDEITMLMDAPV